MQGTTAPLPIKAGMSPRVQGSPPISVSHLLRSPVWASRPSEHPLFALHCLPSKGISTRIGLGEPSTSVLGFPYWEQ